MPAGRIPFEDVPILEGPHDTGFLAGGSTGTVGVTLPGADAVRLGADENGLPLTLPAGGWARFTLDPDERHD